MRVVLLEIYADVSRTSMYYIYSIIVCFCLLCMGSCTSASIKTESELQSATTLSVPAVEVQNSVSVQPINEVLQPAKIPIHITTDSEAIRTAGRLLPELARAVGTYDVQKAFTLFNRIKAACVNDEHNAILIAARERMEPLLATLSIEKISAPDPVIAGSPFSDAFSIRVIAVSPEKQIGLDRFPLLVSYPSGSGYGTDAVVKTERVTTDSEGFVHFIPQVPEKAVLGSLCFYISLEDNNVALGQVPENLRAVFQYRVATAEKKVPSIIAILDYDEHGKPVFADNVTATRTLAGLMKRGFSRMGLDEYRELDSAEEMRVINAAEGKIGNSIERFVFGKTHITVEAVESGGFSCVIQADISVWNFKQARKTNHFTCEYSAEAKTKAQAIHLARSNLGDSVIAEMLQYSL